MPETSIQNDLIQLEASPSPQSFQVKNIVREEKYYDAVEERLTEGPPYTQEEMSNLLWAVRPGPNRYIGRIIEINQGNVRIQYVGYPYRKENDTELTIITSSRLKPFQALVMSAPTTVYKPNLEGNRETAMPKLNEICFFTLTNRLNYRWAPEGEPQGFRIDAWNQDERWLEFPQDIFQNLTPSSSK